MNRQKNVEDETDLLPMLKKFGTVFGCMLFGYAIGYTNMSTWWLSIAAFMWIVRDKNKLLQQRRLEFQRKVAENEKNIVNYVVQDLPCWVTFPVNSSSLIYSVSLINNYLLLTFQGYGTCRMDKQDIETNVAIYW